MLYLSEITKNPTNKTENNDRANNNIDSTQWCNLMLARWFWATELCLWASKISNIRLFGRPTGQATF